MATLTWNPGLSSLWSSDINWSPAQPPGPDDLIVIVPSASPAEIDSSATIGDLVVDGGSLQVDGTSALNVAHSVAILAGSVANAGTLRIGDLTNAGTIDNTGTLSISGSIQTDAGTIMDDGWLELSGSVSTGLLQQIGGSGQILVAGTVDNTGQLLRTGGPSLHVDGTVQGGIVDVSGFGLTPLPALDGVAIGGTYQGLGALQGLDSVTILNGLTGVDLGGGVAALNWFNDVKLVFGNDEAVDAMAFGVSGTALVAGTLTLGSGVLWSVPTGWMENHGLAITGPGSVLNLGTVEAASTNSHLSSTGWNHINIETTAFLNAGLLAVVDKSPGQGQLPSHLWHPSDTWLRVLSTTFVNDLGGTIATGQAFGAGHIEVAATTNFTNNGLIAALDPSAQQGGTIDISADVHGSGRIEIAGGGQLTLEAGSDAAQTIAFLGAGTLTLRAPQVVASVIEGFGANDAIVLDGMDATPLGYDGGNLILQSGADQFSLALDGTFALSDLQIVSLGSDTAIALLGQPLPPGGGETPTDPPVACFAAGTHLETVAGPRRVETLRKGDLVRTISGSLRPVRWIGYRSIDCRTHPAPEQVWPIRIAAHAFGPDMPNRPLLLSPDHGIYFEDRLLPVRVLVNRATIARRRVATVTYYHVELDRHDVVLAEGLPVESYLDTGDRAAFANAGAVLQLHPVFGPDASRSNLIQEAQGYAPLAVTGEAVARLRQRLDDRAAQLRAGRGRRPRSTRTAC
ncbi:MAG: Hint domain-containing protein [Acetobacteraceae bacterium]